VKTRTMPVEMDVKNPRGRLASGMFPEVEWQVRRSDPTLFVPAKAVVTTSERTFVLRVRDGSVEWVTVKRAASEGDLVEVFGDLKPGDQVLRRGTDELRPGTRVMPRVVSERSM
jgi:membrane fusion protein, multidrug efflux system